MTPRNARWHYRAAALVAVALVTALVSGCRSRAERQGRRAQPTLVAAVERAARSPGGELDLRDLLPFQWERFIVLGAYAPISLIHEKLGFTWLESQKSASQTQDRYLLLAFVKGREVVAWMDYDRGRGDFESLYDHGYVARADAIFLVKPTPDRRLEVHPRSRGTGR